MDARFERWRSPRPYDPVEDMAQYRDLTMEQRWEFISGLSRLAAISLEGRPDREAILSHEEPKSPRAEAWWRELVKRGRSR